MRKCLTIAFIIVLEGCAIPEYWWYNPSASQEQANRDHYDCLREAQQRVSGAQVGPYGGSAANTVITNRDLYNACVAARGYYWTCRRNCQ
jgi:hypothetical protein